MKDRNMDIQSSILKKGIIRHHAKFYKNVSLLFLCVDLECSSPILWTLESKLG